MACRPPSIQTTPLPSLRQRARLVVGQPFGGGQPARDLLVAIELLVVLRRRDDRHQLRAAFGGLADLHHLHPVGLLVELLPVLDELRVGGELIVVADVEAEVLLGRGDGLRRRRRPHRRAPARMPANGCAYYACSSRPSESEGLTISEMFREIRAGESDGARSGALGRDLPPDVAIYLFSGAPEAGGPDLRHDRRPEVAMCS